MIIIDGLCVSKNIRAELSQEIEKSVIAMGRPPSLAVILVGDNSASQVYVKNKEKACAEVGIRSINYKLDNNTSENELIALINKLNNDPSIDGILLQLPLPKEIDSLKCLIAIDSKKDVDGFHPENVGRLSLGLPGFVACTAAGIVELMKYYGFSTSGKKAVILGRSNIVGKPIAALLSKNDFYGNATVTLCHSRTVDIVQECINADFLVLAMGKPGFIKGNMVKPGAIVMDVGISRTADGKLCGDADYESVSAVCGAITPVPGGIGPMTIAMLLKNTVLAWKTYHLI